MDREAPFGKGIRSFEPCGKGSEGCLGQPYAGWVVAIQEVYVGVDAFPRHGLGPCQRGLNRGQQRSAPVVFKDPPAAFDAVVFAVIGWVVRQFERQLVLVGKFHEAFDELGSRTGDLRSVVQIDLQTVDVRISDVASGPPLFQTVGHEIAGIARSAKEQIQLAGVHFQNAPGCQNGFRVHIVIRCRFRCLPAGYTAPRESANLHLGFGVEGDAEGFGTPRGLGMNFPQVLEDGVGFGHFF